MKRTKGTNAAAWFYGQSFNGRVTSAAPMIQETPCGYPAHTDGDCPYCEAIRDDRLSQPSVPTLE